jgi:hypothetical protein
MFGSMASRGRGAVLCKGEGLPLSCWDVETNIVIINANIRA